MAPRKSNVSTVSATNEESSTPTKEPKDGVNIEDLSLPKTMVQRLAKGVLPPNIQITKDAALAMQKGATVFVNYLAQAANATAQTNNRRTIPPPAIFDALQELEFEFMSDWVAKELNKYNDTNTGKRNDYRRKVKEEEMMKKQLQGDEGGVRVLGEGENEGDGGERAAKRARLSDGGEIEEDEEGVPRRNGDGGGVNGHDRADDDEVIDLDGDEEEGGEEGPQEEQEEEIEEIEEEEDDEDEFPDEGRRLSSVEADEMLSDGEMLMARANEDEEMSDEGSD